ncbi:hypothetical protein GALMADRAFT_251447 [Galerina marginata CBS 339.88]|uniref:Yeast cell wall synthesis Kre9/Knh1-like N-terminal domain-containing protein n=1 Tax=Galerina marginata (strain CBS 339.88) TaxID=685588 RepID=A0A067SRT1_GALM3|nr:hypothetical protein GALMADRAFT_251447 [Galerina marginata CBS 339.88]
MPFSFASLFAALFFLFAVRATPLTLVAKDKLDVFVPRIIEPDSQTVWKVGQTALIVWDTSNAPSTISNEASVILHKYGVLAEGFDLRDGSVTVTVPDVEPGPWFITLFGDSSNYSPVFTIEN